MPLWPTNKTVGIPYLHDPKEVMWIRLDEKSYSAWSQIYSFTPGGEKTIHIHIGKMMDLVFVKPKRFPTRRYVVSATTVKLLKEHNSISLAHCAKLSNADLAKPGMLLEYDGNSQVIIDGSHRFVARFLHGKRHMDMYHFTMDDVKPALLDLPQDFGLDATQRGKGKLTHLSGCFYDEHGTMRNADGSEVTSKDT